MLECWDVDDDAEDDDEVREPQWGHRTLWQTSENWETFCIPSDFIVRLVHQNSHRAVGGGGKKNSRRSLQLFGLSLQDLSSSARPSHMIRSKQGFQLLCDCWWRKINDFLWIMAIQLNLTVPTFILNSFLQDNPNLFTYSFYWQLYSLKSIQFFCFL